MSRGIRNNNPGNIRLSSIRYRGEKETSTDRAFKQFESMAWGYRAMFMLLHTYRVKHKLSTISQIIARYAPPCENDTDGYADFVAKRAGISKHDEIDSLRGEQMRPIVAAMSRVENGVESVEEDVTEGWRLFLNRDKV